MTLTIRANSLFMKRFLKLKDDIAYFYESALIGGGKKFRYDQIESVLLSPNNVLSIQVGREVFSIPVKPNKPKHATAMEYLVQKAGQNA